MKSIMTSLFLAVLLSGATSASAAVCGDDICQSPETRISCPEDCYCGDGVCQTGESTTSCPSDCYCGNSRCDTGENGANCPQECCDYSTPCTQTQFNAGQKYCRRFSLNNGATWGAWMWISISSYNSQYCSQSGQVCVVEANCHNTYSICVHTDTPTGRFEILPTQSCP